MIQLQRHTHTQFANALVHEALYGAGHGSPMKALEVLANEAVSIWARLQIATTGGFARRGAISTQLRGVRGEHGVEYANIPSAQYLNILKGLSNMSPAQSPPLLSAHPTAFAALFAPESSRIIDAMVEGSSL